MCFLFALVGRGEAPTRPILDQWFGIAGSRVDAVIEFGYTAFADNVKIARCYFMRLCGLPIIGQAYLPRTNDSTSLLE